MDPLIPFSIPVSGLRDGEHHYHFDIEEDFFREFEASPIQRGAVRVDLTFDKRPNMYVLDFVIEGTVQTECDRCLATIDLPIAFEERLLVKFSEEKESEEADVVYIAPDTERFQIAQYVYEYVLLAVPIIKTYDCKEEASPPCNEEMLAFLATDEADKPSTSTGEKSDDREPNPIWEELKKWSGNN